MAHHKNQTPERRGPATEPLRTVAFPTRVLPSWLIPASLGLSVLGLLVSAYLTYEHYTQAQTLACPVTETLNCQKVTSSPWSTLLGMPVALLGLLYFVVVVLLCLPQVWRRTDSWLDAARLAIVGLGVVMVAYLVWAEVARIHAICLWCTVVHVATFLLFCVLVFGRILTDTLAMPAGGSAAGTRTRY